MSKSTENIIVKKSFDFALETIEFCELLAEKRKFTVSNQLLRSGTSIGANTREGQGPRSRADFKNKMKIAYQEAEETEYWLMLCKHSNFYPTNEKLLNDINEILRILGKIISTTTKNEKL